MQYDTVFMNKVKNKIKWGEMKLKWDERERVRERVTVRERERDTHRETERDREIDRETDRDNREK